MLVELEEIVQTDFTRLPWPESPKEQVMGGLRLILADSLSEYPKRRREEAQLVKLNDLAWVFVADGSFKPQPDEGTRVHEDLRGGGRHRRGPPCKSLSRCPDRRKSR